MLDYIEELKKVKSILEKYIGIVIYGDDYVGIVNDNLITRYYSSGELCCSKVVTCYCTVRVNYNGGLILDYYESSYSLVGGGFIDYTEEKLISVLQELNFSINNQYNLFDLL